VDFVKALLNHNDKGGGHLCALAHPQRAREAVMAIEAALLGVV
jgi:hypothetical protein